MAYEAVESLQQTLLLILQCDDNLTTRRVKLRIVSIHDKAVVLQLNLNHSPEKETIREVVNTTEEIIQYLFSPQNLSDFGCIEPTVRLLGKLVEEIDSTVGYVVDYCKSNNVWQLCDSAAVSLSSRSSLKSEVEDLTAATELNKQIVRISKRLRRLAVKIKSTAIELVDEDPINSPSKSPHTSKDVVVDFNEHLSDSAAVASSSRPSPTSKDVVVGFYEDMQQIMDRLVRDDSLGIQVIPIVGMGGIGKSTLAKIVYDNLLIKQHFDICAWVTLSQDHSTESFLSVLLASLKGKLGLVGRESLKATEEVELEINKILSERMFFRFSVWSEPARDTLQEIYKILWGRRYLLVLDDV